MIGWIRLSKYVEQTGDSEDAVHSRRRAGIWKDGVHCRVAGDHRLWINTEAVEQWVRTSTPDNKSGEVAAAAQE